MDRLQKTSRYFLEHLVPLEALDPIQEKRLRSVLSENDEFRLRGFALEIAQSLFERGYFERLDESRYRDPRSGAQFRFTTAPAPARERARNEDSSEEGRPGRALRPPRSDELEEIYHEVLSAIRLEEHSPGAEPGIGKLLGLLDDWADEVEYHLFCFVPGTELPDRLEDQIHFLEPETLEAGHPYRQVIQRRIALQVDSGDPSFRNFPTRSSQRGGVYLLPLFIDGKAWGVLDVHLPGRVEAKQLEGKIQLLASALSHQIYNQRILSKVVFVDWTTQIYNRTFLEMQLPLELEKAKRNGENLALLVLDIDDFKKVNDRCGHDRGDMVLREFASVLRSTFRRVDQIYRFGGEEFVVLLPRLDRKRAIRAAERVGVAVREHRFLEGDEDEGFRLTASIGGAIFPQDAASESRLFRLADEACYRAKRDGKDRVVFPETAE